MLSNTNFFENETPNEILNALESIRHWLSKQPHLNCRTDDEFLLSFLSHCKLRVETVKDKLECYLTFKTVCPEYYAERLSFNGKIRAIVESKCIVFLPESNPNDQTSIIYGNIGEIIKNNITPNDMMIFGLMSYDRNVFYDKNVMENGVHIIIDVKGGTLEFGSQLVPHLKRIVYIIQSSYPIRISGFHFVNLSEAPAIFGVIVKLLKKFMKPKIADRLYGHNNFEDLHGKISKKVLPTEIGGEAGDLKLLMDKYEWENRFLSKESQEWFKNDMKFKSDESKRIGKFKDNELFGIEGSFKKLQID